MHALRRSLAAPACARIVLQTARARFSCATTNAANRSSDTAEPAKGTPPLRKRLSQKEAFGHLIESACQPDTTSKDDDVSLSAILEKFSANNLNNLTLHELVEARMAMHDIGVDSDAFAVRNVINMVQWRLRTAPMSVIISLALHVSRQAQKKESMNSSVARELLDEAVRAIETRWVEVEDMKSYCSLLGLASFTTPSFLAKVNDKMIPLVEVAPPSHIANVLRSLGDSRVRHLPLIKACCHALKKKTDSLTTKEVVKVLVSFSMVNYKDAELLSELTANLSSRDFSAELTMNPLRSIALGLGKLQIKDTGLMDKISASMFARQPSEVPEKDIIAFVNTAARLGYWPKEAEQVLKETNFPNDQPTLKTLDLVWSLAHVGQHSGDMLKTVLSGKLLSEVSTLAEGIRARYQQKMLELDAVARHLTPGYEGPYLSAEDKNVLSLLGSDPAEVRSRNKYGIRSKLIDCFSSIAAAPTFAVENPDVQLYFKPDMACVMDLKTVKPVKLGAGDIFKDSQVGQKRLSVLLCDYHDVLSDSSPNGPFSLRVRLLQSCGFGVVVVKYNELAADKMTNVRMLEEKVNKALSLA